MDGGEAAPRSSPPVGRGAGCPEVLVVCSANICRSPAAAALLRQRWPDGVRVSSAGLHARVGESFDAGMAAVLGDPLPGFTARQLTPELAGRAGVVLTMTTAQRRLVVSSVPTAVRRVFTLREFADLARLLQERGEPDVRLRLSTAVAAVPRVRGQRSPGPRDDIADPHGGDRAAYAAALAAIRAAVDDLTTAVAP